MTKNEISSHNVPIRRITFSHHKGGTGKTTACLSIAGWLSKMGQRVLVVDLDPQANATTGLGIDLKSIEGSISDVFLDQMILKNIILETNAGIYLAPSTGKLIFTESKLFHHPYSAFILNNKLNAISHLFDYILIDSPPGSGLLMINSILAAQNIIIPLDTGIFGYETLEALKMLIIKLEKEFHISINIVMALLKIFSTSLMQKKLTSEIHNMISQYFLENGLKNCSICTIPFSKKIFHSQMQGLPISHYAPYSQVGKTYQKIANNILQWRS